MTEGNRPCAPLFVTVNVTTRCNLNCVYCYMQPMSGIDMPQSDFERIVDELADMRVFLLTLSGGEPFLHSNFPEMFRYAHKRFAHVMTLTNGTAMQPCHMDAIRQVLDEKGAVTVQVSLDAIHTHVNALTRAPSQRTLRTIKLLSAMGCQVIVAIVVTRHNVSAVVNTVEAVSEYTRWFHLMTVQDIRAKAGVEHELEAESQSRSLLWAELHVLANIRDLAIHFPTKNRKAGCATGAPCMAGFSSIVIDPDLIVRPCDRLTDIQLGNLHNTTIAEVWNSAETLAVIRRAEPICRTPAWSGGVVTQSTMRLGA